MKFGKHFLVLLSSSLSLRILIFITKNRGLIIRNIATGLASPREEWPLTRAMVFRNACNKLLSITKLLVNKILPSAIPFFNKILPSAIPFFLLLFSIFSYHGLVVLVS